MKIISGGQTGVDRAALDVALELGLERGGWCPKGRRAEDGRIPDQYPLKETPSANYARRTGWNIRDSDATLILNEGALEGGTRLTGLEAKRQGRRCKVVDLEDEQALELAALWLAEKPVTVLNVAGPRESGRPGIHDRAAHLLRRLFAVISH